MDYSELTLAGLITVGMVNVISIYKPNIDSKTKFILSVITAFVISFIPESIGLVILDKAKTALEVALFASGTYKIAQKVGGI